MKERSVRVYRGFQRNILNIGVHINVRGEWYLELWKEDLGINRHSGIASVPFMDDMLARLRVEGQLDLLIKRRAVTGEDKNHFSRGAQAEN